MKSITLAERPGFRFFRRHAASNSIAVIASAVFFIVTTELSFSTFEPMWDRLRPAGDLKLHQYEKFLSERGTYDTVFIGSSLVFMGINPEIVDPITAIHSFNAGRFNYSALNLIHAVVTEVVASKRRVRTLVVAVDSWAGALPDADRKIIDSLGRPVDLRSQSEVFRNRDVFVHWVRRLASGKLMWPWEAWKDHLYSSGRLDYWGGLRSHANGYLEANGILGPGWSGYRRPQPFGDKQQHYLEDIADRAQQAGVRVVFLRTPEYARTYRESPGLHRDVSMVLQSIAAPRHLNVIDYSQPGSFDHDDKSLFWDMHHLNNKGAAIFSRSLAIELAKIGPRG